MSENIYRTIYDRSAPRAVLMALGQLQPGQAGFATDTNEIIYRKRLNAPVNPGGYVVWPVPTTPAWESLEGKPSAYPPTPHVHSWLDMIDAPAEYPPVYHQHSAADIIGTYGYTHIQTSPAIVWEVPHNLNTLTPSVTIYNSQGAQVLTRVDVVDADTVVITFNAAEYGRARIS